MSEVDLSWLLPDGRCGGRGPEGAITVTGGLPGDRVRVAIESRSGRTQHGRVTEVLTPSPDRRTPPCPWSATCGGCDLDALQPQAQRQAKAGLIRFAMHLDRDPVVVASPRSSAYRARLKLRIQDGRLGYHGRGSHELIEVGTCALGRPEVQQAMAPLRAWLQTHGSEGLEQVELRSDGERAVYNLMSSGSVPRSLRDALPELGDVALDGRKVAGEPNLELSVLGHTLRASPRTFFQVNLESNDLLVQYVLDAVVQCSPDRVLDLYAGIGNFSLPLAAATRAPVLAVELEGQAMDDLRHSAEAAGLADLITALALPVERFDASREPFDVVLLDPPRAGAPGVLPGLLRNRPRRIIYVACHAPSAARDLKVAIEAGYTVSSVQGFDLFPDTHHVETVVVLDRGRVGATPRSRRPSSHGQARPRRGRGG